VDEQHQVDRASVLGGEVHLAHHPHAVRGVVGQSGGVQSGGRLELAHPEGGGDVLEAAPQHVQRAAALPDGGVQYFAEPVQQCFTRLGFLRGTRLDRLGELGRLCLFEPGEDVRRDDGALAVVGGAFFVV